MMDNVPVNQTFTNDDAAPAKMDTMIFPLRLEQVRTVNSVTVTMVEVFKKFVRK